MSGEAHNREPGQGDAANPYLPSREPGSAYIASAPAANGEDPVVRSGRREALVVLCVWLAAMIYTVGYCYTHGYNRPIESLTFVLGFPDWVFWGIVVPWLVCLVISWVFSFVFMADADLGRDADETLPEAGDA